MASFSIGVLDTPATFIAMLRCSTSPHPGDSRCLLGLSSYLWHLVTQAGGHITEERPRSETQRSSLGSQKWRSLLSYPGTQSLCWGKVRYRIWRIYKSQWTKSFLGLKTAYTPFYVELGRWNLCIYSGSQTCQWKPAISYWSQSFFDHFATEILTVFDSLGYFSD
jgi:hypothetical protein